MERYRHFMNKKEIKEFWNSDSEICPPKGNLYHYTSANALSSIIQNQEFWLTKANFMNDCSEITYASNLFLDRLNLSNIIEEEKEKIKEIFKKGINKGIFDNIYVLCLSANYDSLPLWSYYGKSDGYNIGISFDFISDLANAEFIKGTRYDKEKNDFVKFLVEKCVTIKTVGKGNNYAYSVRANYVLYNKEKQIEIFDMFLREIDYLIRQNIHKKNIQINFLLSDLITFIPFMKDSSYINEEEYRVLIQFNNGHDHAHINESLKLTKIQQYRVFSGALIPYISLQLNKTDYIKTITISPFNRTELSVLGIKELTNTYPCELKILDSKIPSRF